MPFYPNVRSRHPSHRRLKMRYNTLPRFKKRVIIRLGSSTSKEEVYANRKIDLSQVVEINTVESIKNSSNKRLMKKCFKEAGVRCAVDWEFGISEKELTYPVVVKNVFGSRGRGNTLIHNYDELQAWKTGKTLDNYIIEKYYNYAREYRLHVDKNGCFYTCRKMLKQDTPEDKKWYRNDDNCVWFLETNPSFNKPSNWDTIVEHAVKALNAVGLDFGACDVRVATNKNDFGSHDFIIVEINSAPSFGEDGSIVGEKYKEHLPKIIENKLT